MTSKKWPKLPKVKVPLFTFGTVYLCRSFKEWQMAHNAVGLDCEVNLQHARGLSRTLYNRGGYRFLVCVQNTSPATLAHELSHTVFSILGEAGVPCREGEGNETFCYLLGALMAHFMPYLADPDRK